LPRQDYLIFKQIDNFFVAIQNKTKVSPTCFKVWQMSSGKQLGEFNLKTNLQSNKNAVYQEKPSFVGVELPDKELMDDYFADFKPWSG
jgi:hypothetical protein